MAPMLAYSEANYEIAGDLQRELRIGAVVAVVVAVVVMVVEEMMLLLLLLLLLVLPVRSPLSFLPRRVLPVGRLKQLIKVLRQRRSKR